MRDIATAHNAVEYLTKADYGKLIGRSERVVERYLKDGRLPDATKDDRGVVIIPSHVRPLDAPTSPDVTLDWEAIKRAPLQLLPTPEPTTVQLADMLPFLPTLAETAQFLRIEPTQVAALRRQGILVGVKIDGRWRITAASIRALGGI